MSSVSVSSAARSIDRHRKSFSLLFYRAVRDLKPVWMLEDMRTMETFFQEEEGDASRRMYSPSEALLYAIVHDHQAYARHLLSRYADEALAKPGERFCCCCPSSSAPHLAMAVRYDRRCILGLILQESHRARGAPPPPRAEEDGRTPLHLACELQRPEALLMLLGSGACPHEADRGGLTPLDVLLEKIGDSEGAIGGGGEKRRQCLDHLLMFAPELRFGRRAALRAEPERWSRLLGEHTYGYVSGRSPAPLLLSAMQTVLRQLSPATFPDSLRELPIPTALKPAGLPAAQRDGRRVE